MYNPAKEKLFLSTLASIKTGDMRLLLVCDNAVAIGSLHANHPQNLKGATSLTSFNFGVDSFEYPSVAGYARKELNPSADQTVTIDTVQNEVEADASDIAYTGLASQVPTLATGSKCIGAVLYDEGGGTEATRIPIMYYDLFAVGKQFDGNGGNVTLQWPSEGFLKLKDSV